MRTTPWLWTQRAVPAVLALVLALETAEAQMVGARADAEFLQAATTAGTTLDHRAIENYIEDPLSENILRGHYHGKDKVIVSVQSQDDEEEDKLIFEAVLSAESEEAAAVGAGADVTDAT